MKRSIIVRHPPQGRACAAAPPHYPSQPLAQDESLHSPARLGFYPALSGLIPLKNIFAPVQCSALPNPIGIRCRAPLRLCASVAKIPPQIRVNSWNHISRQRTSMLGHPSCGGLGKPIRVKNRPSQKQKITKRTDFTGLHPACPPLRSIIIQQIKVNHSDIP
jgi:hypothetical protein